ncbi:hypothetical protein D3C72_2449930 [compost metagenome]
MAGDEATVLVDQHRVGEAELGDRGRDLRDLRGVMGAAVAGIGHKLAQGPVDDFKRVFHAVDPRSVFRGYA